MSKRKPVQDFDAKAHDEAFNGSRRAVQRILVAVQASW
jgi:hypothetical protein